MKNKNVEIGKSIFGLYYFSDGVITLLEEKMSILESDMYQIRGCDYSKIKTVQGNAEQFLLGKIEQKEHVQKRIDMLKSFQLVINEIIVSMMEDELTPYIIKDGLHVDIDRIEKELNYSQRMVYRKVDSWYEKLAEQLKYGR